MVKYLKNHGQNNTIKSWLQACSYIVDMFKASIYIKRKTKCIKNSVVIYHIVMDA